MIVTIPAIKNHGGYFGYAITVRISNFCPICKGRRGEPFNAISFDGSRRLYVDGWKNPCGHVDFYSDVRKEAVKMIINKNIRTNLMNRKCYGD